MLILLVVVGVIGVFYLVRHLRGGGAGAVNRHFGLAPGEQMTMYWSAEFATDISTAERLGTAALGLLAGAALGGIGIATLRARGISLCLTNRDRLAIQFENEDDTTTLVTFDRGTLDIASLGDGAKKLQGGPTKIMRLSRPGVHPIDMLIHHSAEAPLTTWAARH